MLSCYEILIDINSAFAEKVVVTNRGMIWTVINISKRCRRIVAKRL